jgi:hypothetical protein
MCDARLVIDHIQAFLKESCNCTNHSILLCGTQNKAVCTETRLTFRYWQHGIDPILVIRKRRQEF